MDWSLAKLIRIETGVVGISTSDLEALMGLYRNPDSDRTAKSMNDQALEMYSKRLSELIDKIGQIRLDSEETLKVLKSLNDPEGDKELDSWFGRRRDRALGIGRTLIGGAFVLFAAMMGMIYSGNGIPPGRIGLGVLISSATLVACCSISVVHYFRKAGSMDRKLEQVRSAIRSYREPS
jgi:hypothetical protein